MNNKSANNRIEISLIKVLLRCLLFSALISITSFLFEKYRHGVGVAQYFSDPETLNRFITYTIVCAVYFGFSELVERSGSKIEKYRITPGTTDTQRDV